MRPQTDRMDIPLRIQAILDTAVRHRSLPSPHMRQLLREQAGLTRSEIAGALGVTPTTVGRWEKGHRNPRGNDFQNYFELLERLAAL